MMGTFKSFPVAARAIFRDPINVTLALIPTLIAMTVYVLVIVLTFKNADYFVALAQQYVPEPSVAGWVGKFLTALLLLFMFLIMSWTYVLVVGIIAAPFNSMLSARVENFLVNKTIDEDRARTFKQMMSGIAQTFKDEFQKIFFIVLLTGVALFLNLFPLFYPVGIFLLALLLAIQFVDYSWSRHEMKFSACLKDGSKNILPYGGSGLLFLILVSVPIINTLVPAFATSYFTVLWLYRQNKIQL